MQLEVAFSAILPKDEQYPLSVEDALSVSADGTVIAISDGASESFDSQTWAKVLTDAYVSCPLVSQDWLVSAIRQYNGKHSPESLSWSKLAAYERGSFATLLGLRVDSAGQISCLSIGDCLAVFVHTNCYHTFWRYQWARDFSERPVLFSTKLELNDFLNEARFLEKHEAVIRSEPIDHILLMSDAISEWCLRKEAEGVPARSLLSSIRNIDKLKELVDTERNRQMMKVDDVTLVNVSLRKSM